MASSQKIPDMTGNKQGSTPGNAQANQLAWAPLVPIAVNAIRTGATWAANRYGAAGAVGFLTGLAIGNTLRVAPNNPLAIGAIATASAQLRNMGILSSDQVIAFNLAAAAGIAAGRALPPMDIANNEQAVKALAGALNMSETSVKNLIQSAQQQGQKAETTNGTGQSTTIASNTKQENQTKAQQPKQITIAA